MRTDLDDEVKVAQGVGRAAGAVGAHELAAIRKPARASEEEASRTRRVHSSGADVVAHLETEGATGGQVEAEALDVVRDLLDLSDLHLGPIRGREDGLLASFRGRWGG